ncbi:MAG TPA: NAD-dependent epimerase/dehydratase family protein [Ktedonobacterales bacterium]|jgi:nucleoside-diphosphate-sugar epimerase
MRILVVGATGVLGRNVLPRLLERGHRVRAVARQVMQVEMLQRLGVEARLGDILDASSLLSAAEGCDAALHLATAIPKPGQPADWSQNDRIRREGTRNLLAAAAQAGARRYLQQSITFPYGDYGQQIVDESAPLQPAPRIQSAADMEALVQASSLGWCILRGGAFYGPGTGKEAGWRIDALAGDLRLPGDGAMLVSLVHVVDMAHAVVLAVERASAGGVYNVVDDEPVSYRALYSYIAAQLDAAPPDVGGPAVASLGCSNARLKADLGWEPAYPTYRSGLA